MNPAPPVMMKLGEECNFGKVNLGQRQINLEPGSASNELKCPRMQFETRYTYDFVKRFLPTEGGRLLEVGCGAGELAACLSEDGYAVVAIDSDHDSIAAARRLGVDARTATWPDFNGGQFDAVLFTRSLHHIHPLDESVAHAAKSLAEGGRIIVEDFAYESADEKTLRWFRSAIRSLEATRLLIPQARDEFLEKILSKTETLKAWQQNHEHELHTAAQIGTQLEKVFTRVIRENAPYYFRYIAGAITPSDKGDAILQAFANQEEMMAADGSIVPLGRRFVAVK
jgi:2-polyprenyl-3-methyl-5-hydroxy-6-metoxy-1,4-benzoquinol methylase